MAALRRALALLMTGEPHVYEPHRLDLHGAVCPKDGKGPALILPACNTEAMNLHLVEIAKTVMPGSHAVVLVGQAGWHLSRRLVVHPTSPSSPTVEMLRTQPS